MDTVPRVQILNEVLYNSPGAITLWKGKNPIILAPAIGK